MGWVTVPRQDRWDAQVDASFRFLTHFGFQRVATDTYRLGKTTVLANGHAGVHLDADADSGTATVTLLVVENVNVPPIPGVQRRALGLKEIARLRAPALLEVAVGLPLIRREADRAPHLWFWAVVLQEVAGDWLAGDRTWFDHAERELRGAS